MRFTVGIVGFGINPHARCFEDFASAMADAIRALGHEVVPPSDPRPGRLIVFGGNNLKVEGTTFPPDAIIYNAEQVASDAGAFHMQAYPQFRDLGTVVWDYSEANIAALRGLGIRRAVHCPVGYVPSMAGKILQAEEDADVVFYGSVNPRRMEVLRALKAAGLRVVHLYGVYGEERDREIAKAKVTLNLHFYSGPIFEIFRVSHLLANRRCVVSEAGGADPALEEFAARAVVLAPKEKIVEECLALVRDDKARERWGMSAADARAAAAERGFQEFSRIDLVDGVRCAIEWGLVI